MNTDKEMGIAAMKKYGWYEYHDKPFKMVNFKSGQTLELTNVRYKNLPNHLLIKPKIDDRSTLIKLLFPHPDFVEYSSELSFVYKDDEITQAVHFSIIYQKDKFRSFDITIDYSSWLKNPSYGLWRRIDDFLTDAALCWHEGIFENRSFGLTVIGAWFEGEWNPQVKRIFSGRKSGNPDQLEGKYISEPFLEPLNLDPPLQWRYVDQDLLKHEVKLDFTRDNEFSIPFLPKNSIPTGFQGKTAYLMRSDDKAVIFLSLLKPESHRGEDPEVHLYYTFVDQDVFFTFRSCLSYNLEITTLKDYGVRSLPSEQAFYPANIFGDNSNIEEFKNTYTRCSYRIWRKTLNALMDAWPKWEKGRMVEVPQETRHNYGRVGYLGNYGPTMTGGFCGGYTNTSYSIKFETPAMVEELKNAKWVKLVP